MTNSVSSLYGDCILTRKKYSIFKSHPVGSNGQNHIVACTPLKFLPVEEFEKRQKSIKPKHLALTDINVIKQRSDEKKTEAKALKDQGNQFFKEKKYIEAEQCYSMALKLHAGCRILWTNRAICRNTMQKFDEAISDCDSALTIDPKCSKSIVQKGNAYLSSGRYDEARSCFESLRELGEESLAETYLKKLDSQLKQNISNHTASPKSPKKKSKRKNKSR